jgi:hypothetical protein
MITYSRTTASTSPHIAGATQFIDGIPAARENEAEEWQDSVVTRETLARHLMNQILVIHSFSMPKMHLVP